MNFKIYSSLTEIVILKESFRIVKLVPFVYLFLSIQIHFILNYLIRAFTFKISVFIKALFIQKRIKFLMMILNILQHRVTLYIRCKQIELIILLIFQISSSHYFKIWKLTWIYDNVKSLKYFITFITPTFLYYLNNSFFITLFILLLL